MKDYPLPTRAYIACILLGFGLWLARYIHAGEDMGFLLLLSLVCLTLLRWRMPRLRYTVGLDVILAAVFFPPALGLAMFGAMYYRVFTMILALPLAWYFYTWQVAAAGAMAALAGFFLSQWRTEQEQKYTSLFESGNKLLEMEDLQRDLLSASVQIERMTAVSERARIAREIHDNAGHEIVAAYMSLQTARCGLNVPGADEKSLKLYDAALDRLDAGVQKMREAVHNLLPVTSLGVEALQDTCARHPSVEVDFHVFGDTAAVPVYIWGVLEACLNEALTNAAQHAPGAPVSVDLDVTAQLARLSVTNCTVPGIGGGTPGTGLRNLRHRAAAVGGSCSAGKDKNFRLVCVLPIARVYHPVKK